MAERRMFAKSIVLSDSFLDMPMSARCLYFTLGMLADDDGFIGNPKSIMRQCGASQDDMLALIQKRYVLDLDNGVIVIKHWRMNNYLQSDRYKETTYLDEKSKLSIEKNGAYTECIQDVYNLDTQDSIGKDSIGKNNKYIKHKHGNYSHVLLTYDEYKKLEESYGDELEKIIQYFDEYIEEKGYKSKSHFLAIKRWVVDAYSKSNNKSNNSKLKQEAIPNYAQEQEKYDTSTFDEIMGKR